MKLPPEIFVIAVKSITNEMLIEKGWSEGEVVRLTKSGWLDRNTFDLGFQAHPSKEGAEGLVIAARDWFSGVEFEAIPYRTTLLETEFRECDECRVKPGSPVLCPDCYERRSEHGRTGKCRPPRECPPEVKEVARRADERSAALRSRA